MRRLCITVIATLLLAAVLGGCIQPKANHLPDKRPDYFANIKKYEVRDGC